MTESDGLRAYVDLLLLEGLLDGASYGYALAKRIETQSRGQYALKETTLYAAMRRLERAGAIASFPGNETHGRPRTYYELTNEGLQLYRERRDAWLIASQIVPNFVRTDGDIPFLPAPDEGETNGRNS